MASEQCPDDIMFEILTRTGSLKTLDTCKTVSKEWQNMISQFDFMQTYCTRTKNFCGYVIQDYTHTDCQCKFVSISQSKGTSKTNTPIESLNLPDSMQILASTNQGILLCKKIITCSKYRYCVWKPSTGQWQTLPSPKTYSGTFGIGIMVMSSPDDHLRYQIIRLSPRSRRYQLDYSVRKDKVMYRVEIFDSVAWVWTNAKEDLVLPFRETVDDLSPPVSVNRSTYWRTFDDNVITFCHDTNLLDKFPLPNIKNATTVYSNRHKYLFDYRGKLGVTGITRSRGMVFFVLDDQRTKHWVTKLVLNLDSIGRQVHYPLGFYNDDTMLLKSDDGVVFYNIKDGTYGAVKMRRFKDIQEVFRFRSDLERVNLKPTTVVGRSDKPKPLR